MSGTRKRTKAHNPLQRVAELIAQAAAEVEPPPCDGCWSWSHCRATGAECKRFRDYVHGAKK